MFHYMPMSNRSWQTESLVLSLSPFGEGHRNALLLTRNQGLVHAAVFGGPKSSLRARVSPWQTGTAWLYTDPVKNMVKITDFDVLFWRQGLRENLVRTWCASLCTELITKSHGVTDWTLVNAFLDGIAVSDETECRLALLRFLWRILSGAGLCPDCESCSRCGAGISGKNGVLYYSPYEDGFVCPDCAHRDEQRILLSREALDYLMAITRLKPSEVRAIPLGYGAYAELRSFLFFLLNRMVGSPLKTLETGEGIL